MLIEGSRTFVTFLSGFAWCELILSLSLIVTSFRKGSYKSLSLGVADVIKCDDDCRVEYPENIGSD